MQYSMTFLRYGFSTLGYSFDYYPSDIHTGDFIEETKLTKEKRVRGRRETGPQMIRGVCICI